MSEPTTQRDYSQTLFLPKTDFPMRAGLPKKEPEILERWTRLGLYERMRADAKGRPLFVLHDGPPYANGNIHIGHALNKILKDAITRSFQMRGFDSNYVPGWDCHGLPIEWKIEEQYRAKGKDKPDFNDGKAINAFRDECREFAQHWIEVQTEEFKRLGVEGDFEKPYTTMAYHAEARIAGELMKFAMSGQLYRGSKPVMWSVVERTALAEAEVEYQDYESDTVWVKFPVVGELYAAPGPLVDGEEGAAKTALEALREAHVVIWTTTPWTIPGNRAISYSPRIKYGLYEVTAAENDFGPQLGEKLIFADVLAEQSFAKAKLQYKRLFDVSADMLEGITCAHPLRGLSAPSPLVGEVSAQRTEGGPTPSPSPQGGGGPSYAFDVALLAGDHVTEDAGTGFVHTAPGHGREDFDAWTEHAAELRARGIDTAIPFTVGDDGAFTRDAPGFEGARVIDDKGKKGDANQKVIEALIERNMLFARGRLKHTYPHSWRSKKPVIFRNTPQWFVHMDLELDDGSTLRSRALNAIDDTRFVPKAGQARLRAMIADRPDWVLSRQRAWGVPICVFADEDGNIVKDEEVNARILEAFENEGADAWFADDAKERFLGPEHDHAKWTRVRDILDVWFDSGSTHTFTLEDRADLKWPADVYLEGSDQHRGWFHSSLLEACGTRGRAPYDTVITHGFTMDEDGRKMSKSLGNIVAPQQVMDQSGADILRLWVMTTDYWEDQRLGKNVLQTNIDLYRKLRNTMRWMLGSLAHYRGEQVAHAEMPELERLMLHRLVELDDAVRKGYDTFDFKRISRALGDFMVVELSAFYFDIRKDALYCDPISSVKRKAALQVVAALFDHLTLWLAPMLPFTMEEAWLTRHPSDTGSVHLEQFRAVDPAWRDDALAAKWRKVRTVRRVVTGALEVERREKRIGSSLEAAPTVYIDDEALAQAVAGVDMAEVCITSAIAIERGKGPAQAFRLDDVASVAVVPARAEGTKCARSWRISTEVGADPAYPDITPRDAAAMREWEAAARLAGS